MWNQPYSRLVNCAVIAAALGCGGEAGLSGILVVSELVLTPPGGEIVAGTTLRLTVAAQTTSGIPVPNRPVVWSSSHPQIASVSPAGIVTGHTPGGPVTITATVDQVSGIAPVIVRPAPPAVVSVEPAQASLRVGNTLVLTATPRDPGGQKLDGWTIEWISDDETIATVDSLGEVRGVVAGGPVAIRATAGGKTGVALITVIQRARGGRDD